MSLKSIMTAAGFFDAHNVGYLGNVRVQFSRDFRVAVTHGGLGPVPFIEMNADVIVDAVRRALTRNGVDESEWKNFRWITPGRGRPATRKGISKRTVQAIIDAWHEDVREREAEIASRRQFFRASERTASPTGTFVGSITANIGGDSRYTSVLKILLNDSQATISLWDSSARGGMDGPGGSEARSQNWTVPADATSIYNEATRVWRQDSVLSSNGKPSAFVWHFPHYWSTKPPKGFSKAAIATVLRAWSGISEEEFLASAKPTRAPVAPAASFDLSGVANMGQLMRAVTSGGYAFVPLSSKEALLDNGRQAAKLQADLESAADAAGGTFNSTFKEFRLPGMSFRFVKRREMHPKKRSFGDYWVLVAS